MALGEEGAGEREGLRICRRRMMPHDGGCALTRRKWPHGTEPWTTHDDPYLRPRESGTAQHGKGRPSNSDDNDDNDGALMLSGRRSTKGYQREEGDHQDWLWMMLGLPVDEKR